MIPGTILLRPSKDGWGLDVECWRQRIVFCPGGGQGLGCSAIPQTLKTQKPYTVLGLMFRDRGVPGWGQALKPNELWAPDGRVISYKPHEGVPKSTDWVGA